MTSSPNEKSNIINLWISYASFYFGRVNLSLIIPLLLISQDFSKYEVGLVSTLFLFSYAVGQYFHGHFSEKFNPYLYIGIGLILSSIMNLFMGFFGSFFIFLAIGELLDGFFQSMGWSSVVRSTSEATKKRKFWSCFIGTSYQFGNSIAWLIVSITISFLGWKWGFWIASLVMIIAAINIINRSTTWKKTLSQRTTFFKQVKKTLDFQIIMAGISLGLINMIRYGIIIWIPLYLFEVHNLTISKIGLQIFLIPIFGICGTLMYNLFDKKRELVTIFYLVILAIFLKSFSYLSETLMFIILVSMGFFMYGPHVYFVSTVPSRYKKSKKIASATGLIDAIGYAGAASVGLIVPALLSIKGWDLVFTFFSVCSILTIVLFLITNHIGRKFNYRKELHLHK